MSEQDLQAATDEVTATLLCPPGTKVGIECDGSRAVTGVVRSILTGHPVMLEVDYLTALRNKGVGLFALDEVKPL